MNKSMDVLNRIGFENEHEVVVLALQELAMLMESMATLDLPLSSRLRYFSELLACHIYGLHDTRFTDLTLSKNVFHRSEAVSSTRASRITQSGRTDSRPHFHCTTRAEGLTALFSSSGPQTPKRRT